MSIVRCNNTPDILHLSFKIGDMRGTLRQPYSSSITITSLRFNHLMGHVDRCAPQRRSDSAPIAPARSQLAVFELAYYLLSLADRH